MSSSSQQSSNSDCQTCITLITRVSTTTFTPSPFFVTTTFLSLINSKAFPSDTTALSVITTDRTLYTVTVPPVTVTTSLLEISTNSASISTPTSSAVTHTTSTAAPTQSANTEIARSNKSSSDKSMTISLGVILPLFFLLPIALCLWNKYKHRNEESTKRRSAKLAPRGASSEMNRIPLVRTWPGENAASRDYQDGRHGTTNSNGEQLLAVPYSAPHENLSSNTKKAGDPAIARDSKFSALISTSGKSPRDAKTPPIRPERPGDMTGLTNAEISAVASADPYGYKHLAHVRKHSSPAQEFATGQNNSGPRSERPENISEEHQDEFQADQQSERLTQYNFSPSYSLASHNSRDRQAHPPTMPSAFSPPPLRIVKQRDVQQKPDDLVPPPIPEKSIRRSGTFPSHKKQKELGPTRFGPTLAPSEQIREENSYAAEYEREDGTMSPVPTTDERQMRHDRTLAYLAGKTAGGNDYRASSIYSRDEYGTPTQVKEERRREDDDDNVYQYRPKPD